MFLPCEALLSVDHWRTQGSEPPRAFACERWALAGLLSLIYVDSALRKLASPMWRAGLGIVAPAGLPSKVWIDTAWLESIPAPLLHAAGLAVLAFELLFPVLYALAWTRTPAILARIALHLGIVLLYPIPAFSGLMLAIYLALLPAAWYAPLERLDRALVRRPSPSLADQAMSRVPFHLNARVARSAAVVWVALTAINFFADFTPSPGLWRVWGPVRQGVFRATGILDHGVFDDMLFLSYRYQIRLMPDHPAGNPMPYGRDGLFDWSVRDRVWEHWWKRTQAPWVPLGDVERRLGDWANFYWPSGGREPTEIRIEVRPQKVEFRKVDAGVFRENQATPWREVGRICYLPDGACQVRWDRTPPPPQTPLSEFLLRLLDPEAGSVTGTR